jgi:hypothetical protein
MTTHPLLKKKGFLAVMLTGIVLMVWILWKNDPSKSVFFPSCPFYKLTSLYCPGCGSTRALHALLNGNMLGALNMNPLLVASLPLIVCLLFFPAMTHMRYMPHLVGIVLLAYWIARNTPTCSWLAPG